jgi:hypothetical protein
MKKESRKKLNKNLLVNVYFTVYDNNFIKFNNATRFGLLDHLQLRRYIMI